VYIYYEIRRVEEQSILEIAWLCSQKIFHHEDMISTTNKCTWCENRNVFLLNLIVRIPCLHQEGINSFTNITRGQHALDEFFWKRQSSPITLERDSERHWRSNAEAIASMISDIQLSPRVIAIRARGFCITHNCEKGFPDIQLKFVNMKSFNIFDGWAASKINI
jgi:hypothetical protein